MFCWRDGTFRVRAWMQRAELTGQSVPAVQVAAPTFKGGVGYDSILVFLDEHPRRLAGILRPGNAGSNTAAGHISVLDAALAQLPDEHRYGRPILVRHEIAAAFAPLTALALPVI
jgi:hypothetical protein